MKHRAGNCGKSQMKIIKRPIFFGMISILVVLIHFCSKYEYGSEHQPHADHILWLMTTLVIEDNNACRHGQGFTCFSILYPFMSYNLTEFYV